MPPAGSKKHRCNTNWVAWVDEDPWGSFADTVEEAVGLQMQRDLNVYRKNEHRTEWMMAVINAGFHPQLSSQRGYVAGLGRFCIENAEKLGITLMLLSGTGDNLVRQSFKR